MNLSQTLGLVALTGAAFASWYLTRQPDEATTELEATQALTQGYYLKQARIFGTAENGELIYEILADEAEQLSDHSVAFSNVTIRYASETDVPWSLDADTAIIDPAEPRIRLRGHVIAVSQQGFAGNDTEIRTSYLELDPDRYVAETPERVQIRIGARSLTATGMLASLQDNQLQLLSNVSGKFAP